MSNIRVVNLTPHEVTICDTKGTPLVTFPPSGTVAHLTAVVEYLTLNGINVPVTRLVPEDVEGLPDPVEGVLYITSRIIADIVKRPDVACPDMNTAFRDGRRVLGVTRLNIFGK